MPEPYQRGEMRRDESVGGARVQTGECAGSGVWRRWGSAEEEEEREEEEEEEGWSRMWPGG